jgi:hypothetical protein
MLKAKGIFVPPDGGEPWDTSPPLASATEAGLVQPDGQTITVDSDGVISANPDLAMPASTGAIAIAFAPQFIAPATGWLRVIQESVSPNLNITVLSLGLYSRANSGNVPTQLIAFLPVIKGASVQVWKDANGGQVSIALILSIGARLQAGG